MNIKYFDTFNEVLVEYDKLRIGLLSVGYYLDIVTFPLGYGLSVHKEDTQHLFLENGEFSKVNYCPNY